MNVSIIKGINIVRDFPMMEQSLSVNEYLLLKEWLDMKKMLVLVILSVILYSCVSGSSYECIHYKGDKHCTRFPNDGAELIRE